MKLHGHNIKSNVRSSIIRLVPSNRLGNKNPSNPSPNQDQKASNRPSKCDFREIITLTCVKSAVPNDFCFSFDRFGAVTSCSTHKRAYLQPLNPTRLLLHSNLHFCTSISRDRVSDKSRADINMQERGDKLLIGAHYSLSGVWGGLSSISKHGAVKLSSIKRIRAKRVGVIVKAAISSREAKNFRKVISIKARKHFLPRPSGAIVTRSAVATHDDLCAI